MITLPILVVAMALINHARGGGFFADRLPGHPRFYAAPAAAFVCAIFVGPFDALLVGVSYLVWSIAPWGSWFQLGRGTHPDESWFEAVVSKVSFGSDHVAFTLRNFVCLTPAAILISPLFLALSIVQTAAYEAGWRMTPAAPIRTGELLTGAAWGAFIWGLN
jgi:hypothetical protein